MSNQIKALLSSDKHNTFEQYAEAEDNSSLFSRMGSKIGNIFLNTKSNVTTKYLEIVKGFNDSLEKDRLIQENLLQQELMYQASQYEDVIHTMKCQHLTRLIIGIIGAFIVGGIIGYISQLFF